MNKQQYEKQYKAYESVRKKVKQDHWCLQYHIMPESGWLNDPNGLCQLQGVYHVYYQYSPFDVEGKTKLWGHVTSDDLVHWNQQEPVLFPDHPNDCHGVYSGSAHVVGDEIHYYYTGNVKRSDRHDYDYIQNGREQNTIYTSSRDGFRFTPKERILSNAEYPDDMSVHVRDPKIYERDGIQYMVLGARDRQSKGCVLVYKATDAQHFTYQSRLQSKIDFGYMWECPDLFDLDGQCVLIVCPQGVKSKGYAYANVHQCGCYIVDQTLATNQLLTGFQQLDWGFDFYAPQSFMDEQGRRILIGWMGLPDITYTNPTTEYGWQHALTIPRILHMQDGILTQVPVPELQVLRRAHHEFTTLQAFQEAQIMTRQFELLIEIHACTSFQLQLRTHTWLTFKSSILTLSLGDDGAGRDTRRMELDQLEHLWIYSDASSLEIFVNHGKTVFTTRVYEAEALKPLSVTCDGILKTALYEL